MNSTTIHVGLDVHKKTTAVAVAVAVAVARELTGFVWSIARQVEVPG